MTEMTPAEVLALPMQDNDSGADTIRGYLVALLAEVWREGEGFSGKRPFGNSSWEWEIYLALVKADVIMGTFDEYGSLDDVDSAAGNAIIATAIQSLAVSA